MLDKLLFFRIHGELMSVGKIYVARNIEREFFAR